MKHCKNCKTDWWWFTSFAYPYSVNSHKNKTPQLISAKELFVNKINGIFSCHAVPITEGGLGLLLIKGLKTLKTTLPALRIINKYLGKSDALYECQTELIDNGFDKIAQLWN